MNRQSSRAATRWLSALLAGGLAVAACQGAGRTVPAGFEAAVESARRSLEFHWDATPAAPSFAFFAVRCRADGGLLVLFDQRGFAADGLAMAMRGPGVSGDDAWAGGFAPIDPATDPEVEHFFAEEPEVACG